jgi:hypothetical protein
MKVKLESKDRIYRLKRNAAPLTFSIPVRNSKSLPLLYFDEEQNVNRALRYARNQKTPFEDEQDGNAIIEPVVFENGFLSVPRTNPVLQEFLHYHPLNGVSFEEVNHEQDAQKEMEALANEADALIEARQMSVEQLEIVGRVLLGKDVSRMTTAELRRDVLVYAKKDPVGFMNMINDPSLQASSSVRMFFEKGLLSFRNNNKEVWYSTPSNKKKMMNIPYGEDPYEMVMNYLQSEDGIDDLKMLENFL